MTFRCELCGQDHEGLLTDYGFKLPDEVWAIPETERAAQARCTEDLCQLAERYFIRGVLLVPFAQRPGHFGWGVWLEVDADAFQRYLEVYEIDASGEPMASGRLANGIPAYANSKGLPASVKFGTASERPTFWFSPDAAHAGAREQRDGIDDRRYHEILEGLGHPRKRSLPTGPEVPRRHS